MKDSVAPAIAGLAAGVALVVLFAIFIPSVPLASRLGAVAIAETQCAQPLGKHMAGPVELKERTWISVAKIANPSKIIKEKCIDAHGVASKISAISKAIAGADGCTDGSEVCAVSYGMSSSMSDLDLGIDVGDRDDYDLSVSHDEALEIAGQLGMRGDGINNRSAVLAYNGNLYALYLHSAGANDVSAQAAARLENVTYAPVALEKGQSLNYTLAVQTWATYGAPAIVDLQAGIPADSGLQVTVEPAHLVIPERSTATSRLVITAVDANPGIYDIRVAGRINNSSLLFGPCSPEGQCPVIHVGGSGWKTSYYGSSQGIGLGGVPPPENLRAEIVADKQAYLLGETVTFRAYLVNDGPTRAILNGTDLVIAILGPSLGTGNGFVYTMRATYGPDAAPLAVEPHSRLLLDRPFRWDQTTFDSSLKPVAVEGRFSVNMALSGPSYVVHDDTEIAIGTEEPQPREQATEAVVAIPLGANDPSGHYFNPAVVTVPAGVPIQWKNDDLPIHTATSGTPSSDIGTVFDTGFILQGKYSQAITIDKPGTYHYFCQLHPFMTGTVVVTGG